MSKQHQEHPWKQHRPGVDQMVDLQMPECQGMHAHSVPAVFGHDFCGDCLALMNPNGGDGE